MRGVERRHQKPWPLIVVISIVVFLGVAAVPLQVVTFFKVVTLADPATGKVNEKRNAELVRQVQSLQREVVNLREGQSGEQALHRIRNEELHADLCRLIYDIAVSRDITVEPCSPTPKENP